MLIVMVRRETPLTVMLLGLKALEMLAWVGSVTVTKRVLIPKSPL